MSSTAECAQILQDYISAELLQGESNGLQASTPLLEWGIIGSMSMAALVAFIEERFSIALPPAEIVPTNFASIDTIAQMVSRVVASRAA
jgi:acyl carrier protein